MIRIKKTYFLCPPYVVPDICPCRALSLHSLQSTKGREARGSDGALSSLNSSKKKYFLLKYLYVFIFVIFLKLCLIEEIIFYDII